MSNLNRYKLVEKYLNGEFIYITNSLKFNRIYNFII